MTRHPQKGDSKPHKPTGSIPAMLKREVDEQAKGLIREHLALFYVERDPQPHGFSTITQLYTCWHGRYFYFCATCTHPDPREQPPSFELKFTRLEYMGRGRFNLAYQRHTRQWAEVFQGLSLADCLDIIRTLYVFHRQCLPPNEL